ncbi:hypothetical protein IV203_030337 [Nitzschia inconspicua]|uniref:Uncharacterized protein n=1 Tax=Nitzschia inconspicua TaxID=303405 RepID=A0A9K3LVV5_9STRA|nr:hypothetical protein IV203_030337 [Nitzschia inconspicua]
MRSWLPIPFEIHFSNTRNQQLGTMSIQAKSPFQPRQMFALFLPKNPCKKHEETIVNALPWDGRGQKESVGGAEKAILVRIARRFVIAIVNIVGTMLSLHL